MGKKKSSGSRPPTAPSDPAHLTSDPPETFDPSVLVSALCVEYPLIDSTLVQAIVSDYDASDLNAHLDSIRDQLGILQAALVPDSDLVPSSHPSFSDLDAIHDLDDFHNLHLSLPDTNSNSNSNSLTNSTDASSSVSSDDDIGLLRSLFPSVPDIELQRAIEENGVDGAVEVLLSLELIHSAQDRGFWPGEVTPELAEVEASVAMSREHSSSSDTSNSSAKLGQSSTLNGIHPNNLTLPKEKKTKHKTKTKPTKTIIPLVDTLQRRPTPSHSPAPGVHSVVPLDNPWLTISSLAAYLADLTRQSEPYYLSYFHSPQYSSAYAAARAALSALPPPPQGSELALGVLHDLYGVALSTTSGRRNEDDLEVCVRAAGDDVGAVMDLMDLLEEISYWPGDDDWADTDSTRRGTSTNGSTSAVPSPILPGSTSSSRVASPVLPQMPVMGNPNRLLVNPAKLKQPKPQKRVVPGSGPLVATTNPATQEKSGTATTTPTTPSTKLSSSFPNPARKAKSTASGVQHPLNWRKVSHARVKRTPLLHPYASNIPSYARNALPNNSTPGSLLAVSGVSTNPDMIRAQLDHLSPEECWDRARTEWGKREDAIRSASKHFSGGGGGGVAGGKGVNRTVAGVYAAQAREAADKARDWDLRAARMVVFAQLERSGYTAVDLHYLTVNEAVTVSLEVAEAWYTHHRGVAERGGGGGGVGAGGGGVGKQSGGVGSGKRHNTFVPVHELVIVTGLGRHSAGHRGVLGPAVESALEAEGWRTTRDPGKGYLVVKGVR